ncbi:DsrE family protein [Capilliphycus salinus ALCB114379]|uniref:DsrE family protein n=1 Tax=Capilliphycus salinus TaxID=2768948 RepID=UPI0039A4B981
MQSKFLSLLTTSILSGLVGSSFIATANHLPALSETTSAQATENQVERGGLFVNLTTDDTWTANMAISLAHNALKKGHQPTTIFLNVRGVYLVDRERLPATEGNSNLNIHQKLQAFIQDGGKVIVCPSCSREAGLTQADFIEGVVLGEQGAALPLLFDPNTVTVSY